MGLLWLAILGVAALGLLWLLKLRGPVLTLAAAAVVFGCAGYALQVGSAHSVSAFGTLLGRDERPLALTTGVARPLQSGNGEAVVTVFTNQAGRFVAEGLAPGTWVIEMAADGQPTTYTIEVPQGTQGLLQVGVLFPTTKM